MSSSVKIGSASLANGEITSHEDCINRNPCLGAVNFQMILTEVHYQSQLLPLQVLHLKEFVKVILPSNAQLELVFREES